MNTLQPSPDLHAQIMNLPLPGGVGWVPDCMTPNERMGYVAGHRDARHAAAELVSATQAEPAKMKLSDSDVFALIGHAEYLLLLGQKDIPAWLYGLAKRMALSIGDQHLADRAAALAAKSGLQIEGGE